MPGKARLTSIDWLVVPAIFIAFWLVAEWHRSTPLFHHWLASDQSRELGAEYDAIAQSIRQGRGFSDPFKVATGPTAWMPPVLPYLLAEFYALAGDNRGVVVIIVEVLQALVVIGTGWMVCAVARKYGHIVLGYICVSIGYSIDFHELFQKTHDSWLLLLICNATFCGALWVESKPTWLRTCLWGAFGGVAALCGPLAGFSWAAITTLRWIPPRRLFGKDASELPYYLRRLGVVALISIAFVSPWAVRNRVVLGKWIPVKSNLVYEIWQSQCLDDDGILDANSAFQHPWSRDGDQRARYVEVGEIAFVAERWPPVLESLRNDPVGAAQRVANRACVALVYFVPLEPQHETMVWSMRYMRCIFPLPLVGLLIVLAARKFPLERELWAAIAMFAIGLAPYILISYYQRYAAPLIAMKMLLIFFGIRVLLNQLRSWRTRQPV